MHYKLLNDQSKIVNGPWLMAGKSILNIFVWYRSLFLKVNNVICRRLKRKINEENKFLLVWYLKILKWQKVWMFMKNCTSESNIESSDTIYNFLFTYIYQTVELSCCKFLSSSNINIVKKSSSLQVCSQDKIWYYYDLWCTIPALC